MPQEWFNIVAFASGFVSSLLLIIGNRSRIPLVIIAALEGYYGSRDLLAFHCSFVTLAFWFTIALIFDNRERSSCANRLIQIAIFVCYFYSVLQKSLFPDFVAGSSFQALFEDGWPLRFFFVPLIVQHPLPFAFYRVLSVLTIVLETFLAFGLFIPRTRKFALCIGFAFHLSIIILLDDTNLIALYSVIMFIGYLAFMAPPKDWQEKALKFLKLTSADAVSESPAGGEIEAPANPGIESVVNDNASVGNLEIVHPPSNVQTTLALLFAALMFIVPARIYFWPNHPVSTLNFFDRSPMCFAMFLMRQTTRSMSVRYAEADGSWHQLLLKGRMDSASSDNELYALAKFLFDTNQKIERIQIDNSVVINKHLLQSKRLDSSRGKNPTLTLRSEELKN